MIKKADKKDDNFLKTKIYLLPLTSYLLFKKGQSILEYTILLAVIVIIMYFMGPMLKRGTQSLIKVAADQIGNQQNAEQRFDDTGHLEASYMVVRGSTDKQTQDLLGTTTYIFDDLTTIESNAFINLGFTEDQ